MKEGRPTQERQPSREKRPRKNKPNRPFGTSLNLEIKRPAGGKS
jgi:hypothetical protein